MYIGNVETDECSIRTPLQLDKTITEYDLVDSVTKNVERTITFSFRSQAKYQGKLNVYFLFGFCTQYNE